MGKKEYSLRLTKETGQCKKKTITQRIALETHTHIHTHGNGAGNIVNGVHHPETQCSR